MLEKNFFYWHVSTNHTTVHVRTSLSAYLQVCNLCPMYPYTIPPPCACPTCPLCPYTCPLVSLYLSSVFPYLSSMSLYLSLCPYTCPLVSLYLSSVFPYLSSMSLYLSFGVSIPVLCVPIPVLSVPIRTCPLCSYTCLCPYTCPLVSLYLSSVSRVGAYDILGNSKDRRLTLSPATLQRQ